MRLFLPAQLLLLVLLLSCKDVETRYAYHDRDKKYVRAKGEYLDGKLHGKLINYSLSGKVLEISTWKEGLRDGELVSFDTVTGSVFAKSYFEKNILKKSELYTNGVVAQVKLFSESGKVINLIRYSVDGLPEPMRPEIQIIDDREGVPPGIGDDISFKACMLNVVDPKYLSGMLLVGNEFDLNEMLKDTVFVIPSTDNNYNFSLPLRKLGVNKVCVQFIFQFGIKHDSIEYYNLERYYSIPGGTKL